MHRFDGFAPWIKRFPCTRDLPGDGAVAVFPHAGAAASSYRGLASALASGYDTFVMQYPQRGDRLNEPPAETVDELARGLFAAGPWDTVAPLRLFGHSMGAVVAFEFARIAEEHGVAVRTLWVSSGPVPSSVAGLPTLPTDDAGLLADLADLGGTDPRLLADAEFAELVTNAARCDYRALNNYECAVTTRVRADIHAVGGRQDRRVDAAALPRWANHTEGAFSISLYDGGHFYVNEHIDAVAAEVNSDVG